MYVRMNSWWLGALFTFYSWFFVLQVLIFSCHVAVTKKNNWIEYSLEVTNKKKENKFEKINFFLADEWDLITSLTLKWIRFWFIVVDDLLSIEYFRCTTSKWSENNKFGWPTIFTMDSLNFLVLDEEFVLNTIRRIFWLIFYRLLWQAVRIALERDR